MTEKIKNKEGGFIELIILIIIVLIIMKYSGITVSEVVNWFMSFFRSVLR
jgi:hypothetical protein